MSDRAAIREAITSAHRRRRVDVEEHWNTTVWVQPLPVSLARKLLAQASTNGAGPEADLDVQIILEDLIIHGMVDESGERVYTEDDREEVENLDFRPAMQVALEVLDISGMTEAAEEDIEGN